MSTLGRIARNAALQAGSDVLSKSASLAFYVVMARELGKAGFGDYMFALSLAILLTSLAGFGTDSLLTRLVAKDRDEVHRIFWNAVALKLVLGILLAGIAVLVTAVGGYSAGVRATVAILGLASISELVAKTIAATFLAYDDLRPVAVGLIVQRFSTAIFGIAALVSGAGIVPVAVIYLGGALLGLLSVIRALIRHDIRPRRDITVARARRVASDAVPYGLKLIFGTVIFRVDATILSLMKGAEATGLYSAAYRALESTLFIGYAFEAAMFPTFARLRRDTTPPVAEMFEISQKTIVAIMAPVGIAFVIYGRAIIELLYGQDFSGSTTAMHWLGGAAALYGISLMSSSVLLAGGRAATMAWIAGAVMVENVVLNLIFIPQYSLNGAAAITTVTEITQAVVFTAFALRLTGRVSARRIFASPLAGSVAMTAAGIALPDDLPWLALTLALYAAALVLSERLLYPADVARLLGALRVRIGGVRVPKVHPPLILAYHGVCEVPAHLDPEGLFISPRDLRRQIAQLKRWGYEFLNFGDISRRISAGTAAGCVSLTFDDGLVDNLEQLVPILRDEGVTATTFVTTDWMGKPHPSVPYARNMTPDEVRALHAAGVEIGGHTVTHADLREMSFEAARDEVRVGCEQLAEIIGEPVDVFAYPFGFVTPGAIDAARAAGVRAACGVAGNGSFDEPLNLPRQDTNYKSSFGLWLKRDDRYERLMRFLPAKAVRRLAKERRLLFSRLRRS